MELLKQMAREIRAHGENIVFVDVGAAGGFPRQWTELAQEGMAQIYGFEPDVEALAKIPKDSPGTLLPYALGDREEDRTLYLTRMPACSSVLEPTAKGVQHLPVRKVFDTIRTVPCSLIRMDTLVARGEMAQPDFIKTDVQGFDYEVLKGAEGVMENVAAVSAETQFVEIYKGQKLFGDIREMMYELGFILRHIHIRGPFDGEVLEADVFFSRPLKMNRFRPKILLWERATKIKTQTFLERSANWPADYRVALSEEDRLVRSAPLYPVKE